MAGINFLSRNLIETADISLTTGTENAQFPLVNLSNEATAVRFRSLENTVVILFDLKQVSTIDAIALHGDTNGDLGLTAATFRTSTTLDFSSSTPTNIPLSALERSGYAFFDEVAPRYVELTLTGGGTFCEVSNAFIGKRINLPQQNISISGFVYGEIDQSNVSRNDYGQTFVDKRNKIKTLGGPIQHCIRLEQAELDEMFSRHGISKPLWVVVDPDSLGVVNGRDRLSIYGYFTAMPTWSAGGGQTWNTQIDVRQAG